MADFRALQRRFADHLRHSANPAPTGIEDRRLKIYRDLFFNNVEGFLANAFPVLRKTLSPEHWRAMAQDFYRQHRCTQPQFYQLAEEFLRYLAFTRTRAANDPPWLWELAHYEWVELALGVAEQDLPAQGRKDLLAGRPQLSPLAWLLVYDWPVQTIGPDQRPLEKPAQQTYLVVNRNRADDIHFMQLNPATARLLVLLREHPQRSGRAQLHALARELGQAPDALEAAGAAILARLASKDIVLGAV